MSSVTQVQQVKGGRPFPWGRVLLYVILALFMLSVLIPFYWMLRTSLMAFGEIVAYPPRLIPQDWFNFSAYGKLFEQKQFIWGIRNSLVISTVVVALTVVCSTLGSYAVARMRFPGKAWFMRGVIVVYMFPAVMLMIPMFVIMSRIRMTGTGGIRDVVGLIVVYLTQTMPVAIYMLSSYFITVPEEIEEAGIVDGCTRWSVIYRITIPLSVPAIASVALYTFMIAWNEYMFAFILLKAKETLTLPIAFYRIFGQFNTAWDMVMAAAIVISVPVIIAFLASEKSFAQGLTAGGVKG
ncbi:MAG: carbohydrate ABC transporter permease [Chloroflexota bacterium]|nr:carbohydrate ABC transporter permease [Chloroflexota bacterium]